MRAYQQIILCDVKCSIPNLDEANHIRGSVVINGLNLQTMAWIKLMEGKYFRKHSLYEKTAASVLLKLSISSNEWCHTTDAFWRMSGTPFSNVNNIHVHSMIPEGQKNITTQWCSTGRLFAAATHMLLLRTWLKLLIKYHIICHIIDIIMINCSWYMVVWKNQNTNCIVKCA